MAYFSSNNVARELNMDENPVRNNNFTKRTHKPTKCEQDYSDEPKYKRSTVEDWQESVPLNTQTNIWPIDITKMPIVEKFHIFVTVGTKNEQHPVVFNDVVLGEFIRQSRRWGIWSLWKLIFQVYPSLFTENVTYKSAAYNCYNTFYMPYGLYKGKREETLCFFKKEIQSDVWKPISFLSRNKFNKVLVRITRIHDKNHISRIYPHGDEHNQAELLKFLNVVMSQRTNEIDFISFDNLFYKFQNEENECDKRKLLELNNDNNQMEAERFVIQPGFNKELRFIKTSDNDKSIPVIIIDPCYSLFYRELELVDFVAYLYNYKIQKSSHFEDCYPIPNNEEDDILKIQKVQILICSNLKTAEYKLNELNGITVTQTFLPDDEMTLFQIEGLHYKTPKDTIIEAKIDESSNAVQQISVFDFYLQKYDIELQYTFLPLVIQKTDEKVTFWPMELLKIVKGQKVRKTNIPENNFQTLEKVFVDLPSRRIKHEQKVLLEDIEINNNFMTSFEISININDNIKPSTFILPAPIIKFGSNQKNQPKTGCGIVPTVFADDVDRFYKNSKFKSLTVLNFDNALKNSELEKFCCGIKRCSVLYDTPFECRLSSWKIVEMEEKASLEQLENVLRKSKNREDSLVIGIVNKLSLNMHDRMKLFDNLIGIKTFPLLKGICKRAVEESGKKAAELIFQKLNAQCGGINFTFSFPTNSKSIYCSDQHTNDETFFKKTMYVAFHLSVVEQTNLLEHELELTRGEPSVIGVTYSLREPTEIGEMTFHQRPTVKCLFKLDQIFPKVVMNHYLLTNSFPENIVIYRNANDDSELTKILEETELMRLALIDNSDIFNELKMPYQPKIVVIVALKNELFRCYPQNTENIEIESSLQQNVPSGTCIDSLRISNSQYDEFILYSQPTFVGTASPTRFLILMNDPFWTKKELSFLTYFLTFANQEMAPSTGVPHILFAAEKLSRRKRDMIKVLLKTENIENAKKYL